MNFDDYMPANEEEMQQWNDMIDRMEISEQLRLFCKAVSDATTAINLVIDLGSRVSDASDADLLNKDQLSKFKEAHMGVGTLAKWLVPAYLIGCWQ